MGNPSLVRLKGRLTTLFDPTRAEVTEVVTEGSVIVHVEKPRDGEFWMEFTLSEEWLLTKLAEIRQAQHALAAEESRRRATAVMPAWTPGREFA